VAVDLHPGGGVSQHQHEIMALQRGPLKPFAVDPCTGESVSCRQAERGAEGGGGGSAVDTFGGQSAVDPGE
jgi:hypothetical protein